MTPEERDLLTRSIKISEENNKILKSMRRSARFSSFMRFVYWAIVIGLSISVYYFMRPYLEAITKGYTEMQKGIENVTSVTNKIPKLPSWLGGE